MIQKMSIQTKSLGAKASLSVWGSPDRRARRSRVDLRLELLCNRRVETEDSLFNYILTQQLILKINKDTVCFPRGMHLCRHL